MDPESPNLALTNHPGHVADRESSLATKSRIASRQLAHEPSNGSSSSLPLQQIGQPHLRRCARSATRLALDGPAGLGPVTPAGRCRALFGAGGASVPSRHGCQAVRGVSTSFQTVESRTPLPKWRRGCQRCCRVGSWGLWVSQ